MLNETETPSYVYVRNPADNSYDLAAVVRDRRKLPAIRHYAAVFGVTKEGFSADRADLAAINNLYPTHDVAVVPSYFGNKISGTFDIAGNSA